MLRRTLTKRIQAVDLLEPARRPCILVDRVLAAHAVRFAVYGVHIFPLPHFHRLFGTAGLLPLLPPLGPEEVILEIIGHLGGGNTPEEIGQWLKEHFPRFEKALEAVGLARRKAMFEQLDAQFGKAVYELAKPLEECRARLRRVAEIEEEPLEDSELKEGFIEGCVWFAQAGEPERRIVGEGATIGRILLGPTHLRLESMGAERLGRLRQRFESLMRELVRFVGERRDDLGRRIALKEPSFDATLVPPALLREPQHIVMAAARVPASEEPRSPADLTADYLLQRDKEYLDEPVPALEGKSPRQAASEPALRPVLIGLMKEHVQACDTYNLETGRGDDVNWMLRELGLTEILFEPPPARPPARLDSFQQ